VWCKDGGVCAWCLRVCVHAAVSNGKRKMEAQVIFLYLFTICSLCKWKFIVCPLVDEETNKSYLHANSSLHAVRIIAAFCLITRVWQNTTVFIILLLWKLQLFTLLLSPPREKSTNWFLLLL
jgi:hypothetical protein